MKQGWRARLWQAAIAFDQLLNCLVWLDSTWADETFSAKCYRLREKKFWTVCEKLVNALFFWEDEHCRLAYYDEIRRKHLPKEYRME